jgi:ComF family protein
LDYASPVDRLVLGGKFSQRLSYLSLLAELFIMYWQKQSAPLPDIIIPVPLHARRLRERGYNQALELARIIGRHLQVPIDFCSIKRTKTTLAQASLPASQRRENISDAFACTSPITYSRVALVDDVLTTGNTVRALSQTLRQAGVAHIDVYCIARTLHL